MFTSNLKTVIGGSIVMLTMLATTAVGQTRPEFSREYWANKRLPDSMKGISPENLAAIARMNEAARQARAAEKASPKDGNISRAGGAVDLTQKGANGGQSVVQTGAATPLTGPRRPTARQTAGILEKIPGLRPKQTERMAGPPRMQNVQGMPPQMMSPQMMSPEQQLANQAMYSEVPRLLEQARAAKQAGDLAVARDLYRKILKIEPYNREVLVNAGRTEHAMGDIDNAIQAYEYLLRIEPGHAVGLNDLGLCWARKGDMRAALKSLQGAVEASPRSIRYRNNLAKVLIETNQLDAAEQVLTQLRGKALGQAGVGALLAERGRVEEARTYLQAALVSNPNLVAAQQKLDSLAAPVEKIATAPESATTGSMTIQTGGSETEMKAPELSIQR